MSQKETEDTGRPKQNCMGRLSGSGVRVLVIEDDEMNTQLLQEICEGTGFSVFVASNGEEGVDRAREYRPDLILLDIMMPRLDGFGVLSVLREDPSVRGIPVLVVSAVDEKESREKAMSLGAHGFVRKPFSVAFLQEEMAKALTGATDG